MYRKILEIRPPFTITQSKKTQKLIKQIKTKKRILLKKLILKS